MKLNVGRSIVSVGSVVLPIYIGGFAIWFFQYAWELKGALQQSDIALMADAQPGLGFALMHGGATLASLLLTLYYFVDISRNEDLSSSQRWFWYIFMITMNVLAFPWYYYSYYRKRHE